jgi:hypothetical protein
MKQEDRSTSGHRSTSTHWWAFIGNASFRQGEAMPATLSWLLGIVVGNKFMNTRVCRGLDTQSCKELYQAALCESDLNKLPQRITDAETAIVMRTRETALHIRRRI